MPVQQLGRQRARMRRSGSLSAGPTRGGRSTSSTPRPNSCRPAEVLARIARLYEIEGDILATADLRKAVPSAAEVDRWSRPCTSGYRSSCRASPAGLTLAERPWLSIAASDGLILYLDDRRLEMNTNVVERAIRPVTITRRTHYCRLRCRSRHSAIANTLIQTCKQQRRATRLSYRHPAADRLRTNQSHELRTLLPWTGTRTAPPQPTR